MPRINPDAPAVTGSVLRLSYYGLVQGQIVISSFDFMGSSPAGSTAADMAAFFALPANTFSNPYLACLASTYRLQQITLACLSNNTVPTLVAVGSAPGLVAGENLPTEVQANIIKRSLLKGQHGRGSVQMPAVPITFSTPATDPNTLNATGRNQYAAFAAALLAGTIISGRNYRLCIATRPVAPAVIVSKAVLVDSMQPRLLLGYQRRRRPGRGI